MTIKSKILITIAVIFILLMLSLIIKGIINFNSKDNNIPIIMYHSVENKIEGTEIWTISTEQFLEQVKYLKENNYKTIFIEDINRFKNNKNTVILTFDDGYENFYTNVFPILKEYNIKANLYMTTNFIGKDNYLKKEQLKEMIKSNLVSIGSHTLSHISLISLSEEELKKELSESKNILEELLGKKVKTIAYPYGRYNNNVIKSVKKYYKNAIAIEFQQQNMKEYDRHSIKRVMLTASDDLNYFKRLITN